MKNNKSYLLTTLCRSLDDKHYGKNIHSILGMLFLGSILDYSLSIKAILSNIPKVFYIFKDLCFQNIENLFNIKFPRFSNLPENQEIINKAKNKITKNNKTLGLEFSLIENPKTKKKIIKT